MTSSAIVEHIKKNDGYHDGALLTLSDWSRQLVASTASGLELKLSRTEVARYQADHDVSHAHVQTQIVFVFFSAIGVAIDAPPRYKMLHSLPIATGAETRSGRTSLAFVGAHLEKEPWRIPHRFLDVREMIC
ncbi:unnamed protein product [Ixodes persulcatus]